MTGAALYSGNQAWDQVDAWHRAVAKVTGELARSELLAAQYQHDNEYLQAENLRLNHLPVKVVYRCEEKRPMPAFAKEWTYR